MATTNDLKNGMTLNLDGNLMNVVEFQHVKPGKGGAFVRTKLKNVRTGRTLDKTFRADEPVEVAILDKREMQFLYRDETGFVFMDTQTYDQAVVDAHPVCDLLRGHRHRGRAPSGGRAPGHRDRARHQGRPRLGRDQAGHGRDRGGGPGAAVRGDRRPRQGRHPLRGVPDPGAVSGPVAAPGTRSAARRRALDILFEADLLDRPVAEVLARHRDDREAGALDAYTVELVEGVAGLLPRLDASIADAAEHWTIDRMPLVDRNLLRLAAYELTARPEVPTAVVLDEAIELAKLLSTADSGRFVNGVLAHVAAEVRGSD
jgi:transcription antitermination factor NusB